MGPHENRDAVRKLTEQVRAGDITSFTAAQLQELEKAVKSMYEHAPGTEEGNAMRADLAALRSSISEHQARVKVAEESKRSFAALRDTLITENPDNNRFSSYAQVGLNRYLDYERENFSDTGKVVVRTGIIAAVTVGGMYVINTVWGWLKNLSGSVVASATTLGGAVASVNVLPEPWKKGIFDFFGSTFGSFGAWLSPYLPSWMTGIEAPTKLTKEEVAKRVEQRDAQQTITDTAIAAARKGLADASTRDPLIQNALKQIRLEQVAISALPAEMQAILKPRIAVILGIRDEFTKALEETVKKAAAEKKGEAEAKVKKAEVEGKEKKVKVEEEVLDKATREKLIKEVGGDITRAIQARPVGPLLSDPGWEFPTGDIDIIFGPRSIIVRRGGTRFEINATMEVEGRSFTFDAAMIERQGTEALPVIRFRPAGGLPAGLSDTAPTTATMLSTGLSASMVTPTLAEAIVQFRSGANSFEKNFAGLSLLGVPPGTLRLSLAEIRS